MTTFDIAQAYKEAKTRFDTRALLFMVAIHVGAVAALFFWSWTNVLTGFLLYVMSGMGITIGYHRLLSHQSFKTWKGFEYFWALMGVLAAQRGPILWVAQHRQHHSKSDSPLDPHDINKGFFWAHMLWVFSGFPAWYEEGQKKTFAPDLLKDPVLRFLDKYYLLPITLLGVGLFWAGGLPLFLWGFCLRMVCVYHFTWFVNSAAHTWGYRHFKAEKATNNWWVALLTFGEGWHNNHHQFPTSARHGLRAWEIDVSWISIWFMSKFGMAQKIRLPRAEELPWKKRRQA